MEFFILRNVEVRFTGKPSSKEGGLIERVSRLIDVEIQGTKDDDNGIDNQITAKELTTALIENPWTIKDKKITTAWNLNVAISLPDPIVIDDDVGIIKLSADKRQELSKLRVSNDFTDAENFLDVLQNTFNRSDSRNVTINVVIKYFGLKMKSSDNPALINWRAKGVTLETIRREEKFMTDCVYKPLVPVPEERMLLAWKNGKEFCGTFTISVVLNSAALSALGAMNLVPDERFDHLKDLLEKEICTDLEILAGESPNQKVVKCHRTILAAGSKVFQRMFESGMKEATGNRIEIEEMSEKGVRAMLAYLYHRDITAAYESSEVALELLEAGEKYDVQRLKTIVRDYMLAKENCWFGMDMLVELYVFVRAICSGEEEELKDEEVTPLDDEDIEMESDGEEEAEVDEELEAWKSLKVKCLKVLKWYTLKKPKTLVESAKYQEIIGGNLKLAMEVSAAMLRLK